MLIRTCVMGFLLVLFIGGVWSPALAQSRLVLRSDQGGIVARTQGQLVDPVPSVTDTYGAVAVVPQGAGSALVYVPPPNAIERNVQIKYNDGQEKTVDVELRNTGPLLTDPQI